MVPKKCQYQPKLGSVSKDRPPKYETILNIICSIINRGHRNINDRNISNGNSIYRNSSYINSIFINKSFRNSS